MKYQDLEILRNANNVCLISHINPDADALASMVTMKDFLMRTMGVKSVQMFAEANSLPENYAPILAESKLNKEPCSIFDFAIMLDCPNIERLGAHKNLFLKAQTKIVIDHHSTNLFQGDINIVENVSSTCEIVYQILKEFNHTFSTKDKEDIYAGIITDTNNFSVGNIGKQTLSVASEIIEDIDSKAIYENHFSNNSFKNMKLLALAINNIKSFENGNILISHVSLDKMRENDANFDDFTGIINRLSTISGSKLVCLIYPKNNEYYVSMRSKPEYNISTIATAYGGGGHKCAAAFNSSKSIEEIETSILSEFLKLL